MLRRFVAKLSFTRRVPDGERGSVLVMASIATVMALSATALAVDLGKAVSTKRSLQTVVDIASLDAVRAVGDRRGYGNLGESVLVHTTRLAKESLERNDYDPDLDGNAVRVDPGVYDRSTGVFTAACNLDFSNCTDNALWNAVQVKADTTKSWSIAPGTKAYSATGTAAVRDDAGIAVGSFLVRLDTQQSILNSLFSGLLGGSVSLDLVSYRGLADAQVTLGALRTELLDLGLSVGTVDELLGTEITVAQLLTATAAVLTDQGNTFAATVNGLAASIDSNLAFRLGDLITVAHGSESAALGTALNVFQLVQGSAQLADGDHFLSVNLPTLGIPGLASASLKLQLIEAPQMAIGPVGIKAETAQLRAQIITHVAGALVNLPIYVEGAAAEATLTGIDCDTPSATVQTVRQALAAYVGDVSEADLKDLTTPVTVTPAVLIPSVLGLGALTISSTVTQGPVTDSPLTFTSFGWGNKQTVGSNSLDLSGLLNSAVNVRVGGGLLGSFGLLNALVNAIVNPILGPVLSLLPLLDALLDPLLESLGLMFGGADVWAFEPHCSVRSLVE